MKKLIKCNVCGSNITLEDAVLAELNEELYKDIAKREEAMEKAKENLRMERVELDNKLKNAKKNYKQQLAKDREEIRKELKEEMDIEYLDKVKILENEIKEKNEKIKDVEKLQFKLAKQKAELAEEKRDIELVIEKKVNEEKQNIFTEAKNKAFEELSVKINVMQKEINEKDKIIKETEKLELELLHEKRKIEEKERRIDLEVAKRVDNIIGNIRKDEREKLTEEYRLKEIEKDKKIDSLLKEIDNLQKKASNQTSQKLQGAALEDNLLEMLKRDFQTDEIEVVTNGTSGADIIQYVKNQKDENCGIIVWEVKNTKQWSEKWILKLKQDTRKVKGDISILLTSTLPKNVSNFRLIDGVWVTNYMSAISLAYAIRANIIKIYNTKIAIEGKNKKSDLLYKYLCSNEFKQKIEAITDTLSLMNASLDREKKSLNKLWNERKKHIEYIAINTGGLYGDVKGIIGSSLSEIENLNLSPIEEIASTENLKQEGVHTPNIYQ